MRHFEGQRSLKRIFSISTVAVFFTFFRIRGVSSLSLLFLKVQDFYFHCFSVSLLCKSCNNASHNSHNSSSSNISYTSARLFTHWPAFTAVALKKDCKAPLLDERERKGERERERVRREEKEKSKANRSPLVEAGYEGKKNRKDIKDAIRGESLLLTPLSPFLSLPLTHPLSLSLFHLTLHAFFTFSDSQTI